MELRHIRYFVRAAEFLHFTRAAESLSVSQPALSIHIQQLEKELGLPLFDRTGRHVRHVRLTEAGKRLLVHAREMLRALEQGKQEIADLQGLVRGTVTVGANNIFVPRIISRCITKYSAAYPGVDVVVKMANLEELETWLLNGAIDLGLAWLPPESDDIESEVLLSDELVLVVAASHPYADRERVCLRDLDGIPLALPTLATNTRRLVNAEFARETISPAVTLEIDDTPARLTFVEAGTAATLAPRKALDDRPSLRIIPIADVKLLRSAGLLTPRGIQLSSAARMLADTIRECFPE